MPIYKRTANVVVTCFLLHLRGVASLMWESSSTEELAHFERIVRRNPLVVGSTPTSPLEINLGQGRSRNSCRPLSIRHAPAGWTKKVQLLLVATYVKHPRSSVATIWFGLTLKRLVLQNYVHRVCWLSIYATAVPEKTVTVR